MAGQRTLYLYRDPAYKASFGIMCLFTHKVSRHLLLADEKAFNARLSSIRISVEHAFGHTQVLWTYTAFTKQLKLDLQLVAVYFAIAVFLTNCYTCLQGNQTSKKFVVQPLSLQVYLNYI
jgi:hypothetical protein